MIALSLEILFWHIHFLVFKVNGMKAGMTFAWFPKDMRPTQSCYTRLSVHTPIATSDPVGQCQPDLTGMKSSKTEFLQGWGKEKKGGGGGAQPTKNRDYLNQNKQISDIQNPSRRET